MWGEPREVIETKKATSNRATWHGSLEAEWYRDRLAAQTGHDYRLGDNISTVLAGQGQGPCLGIEGAVACAQTPDPWGEGTIVVFGVEGLPGVDLWFLAEHDANQELSSEHLSWHQQALLGASTSSAPWWTGLAVVGVLGAIVIAPQFAPAILVGL